jgi:DNA-binding MarR family transcriptional regulator
MIDRNSDVSRILERLVQKQLVERTENSEDRRQKDVRISKAGLDLLKEIDGWEKDMDKRLDHFSESDAKRMNDMLDKLRTGF